MVRTYLMKHVLQIVILGALDAIVIWVGTSLAVQAHYLMAVLLLIGTAGINYVYLSKRAYPMRYLLPGLIFLFAMVVYPIGYSFYISFTNLSTGHILNQQQAIAQITDRFYTPDDAPTFTYTAFKNSAGDIAILLHGSDRDLFYYQGQISPVKGSDDRFVDEDGDNSPDKFLSYKVMSLPQIIKSLPDIEGLRIPYDGGTIRLDSLHSFKLSVRRYSYDQDTDTIHDLQTGTVYKNIEGFYTSDDGEELYPGFKVWMGFRNYLSLVLNPLISGPFARVFGWTVIFASLSVLTTFATGLFLAILLNDPYLKLRRLYRVLVIVPYALPAFISILIWHGLLTNMGLFNHVLLQLFHISIPWLESTFWAKISGELYEAARVDGATWWHRFSRITLPLLLMPLAPLLIGSFAFNFNNFTLIWLLTEGGPPINARTVAQSTDILLSYAYRLAFQGARGNQFALAAAVSVIIFFIIATISAINFRLTGALEDLSKNV